MTDSKNPAPSTALVFRPADFGELQTTAKYYSGSPIVAGKFGGKEENVALAIQTGLELGLSPMQSILGINIIEGKPALAAATKQAIVMQSHECEYFRLKESSSRSCTYVTKRRGQKEQEFTYTIDEARMMKGGRFKPNSNWARIPRDMLRARCKSRLVDLVYPDLALGLATPDDLYDMRDMVNDDDAPEPIDVTGKVVDAELVEDDASPAGESDTFVEYEERGDTKASGDTSGELDATDRPLGGYASYWGRHWWGQLCTGVALAAWSAALWESEDRATLKATGKRLRAEFDTLPDSPNKTMAADELRELYKEAASNTSEELPR